LRNPAGWDASRGVTLAKTARSVEVGWLSSRLLMGSVYWLLPIKKGPPAAADGPDLASVNSGYSGIEIVTLLT